MHFQAPPHVENKLVTCSRGAIYDVVIDVRRESPLHGKWATFTLTADNGEAVFIHAGCPYGFITLEDDTTVRLITTGARGQEIPNADIEPDAAGCVRCMILGGVVTLATWHSRRSPPPTETRHAQ